MKLKHGQVYVLKYKERFVKTPHTMEMTDELGEARCFSGGYLNSTCWDWPAAELKAVDFREAKIDEAEANKPTRKIDLGE